MFKNNPAKWKWIFGFLVVANIAYYFYVNWGLVTVKVTDAPLGKVISSIEWQGWVKIYTNLPLDAKVTMYVDHVPLAEAMETLAANVDVPPANPDDGTGQRPNRNRPPGPAGPPDNLAGGPPGGGSGGRGGGGFGRRAEWNLAFFVAPTPAGVKQEIRAFQNSDPGDDSKVFAYGTQLELVATETVTNIADPRLQAWPGMKPVDPSIVLTSTNTTASPTTGTVATDPSASTDPNVQAYLQAFAQSANIWIMAPASWAPEVSSVPPPSSSIISAVKNLVSSAHGAFTQAIVLRVGRGGPRGNPGGDNGWEERMRNAISGLPPDERPDALDQLNKEVQFRKDIQALPPEQRRQKFIQHMMERMVYGERLSRMSPAKRAQLYKRMIGLRNAAKGQQ